MARGIARLVSGRQARRRATPVHLDTDGLRAGARRSYQGAERALHEWHAFVDGLQRGPLAGRLRPGPAVGPPGGLGT